MSDNKPTTDNTITAEKITADKSPIKPGRVYVGDPCYVFPDKLWHDFCDALWNAEGGSRCPVLFKFRGGEFVVSRTAYGDGTYPVVREGEKIGEFGVDAGLFSIIPIELIESWGEQAMAEALRLGVITDLEGTDLIPGGEPGGILTIGNLLIDTEGSADEDEEEDDPFADEDEDDEEDEEGLEDDLSR